MKGIVTDIQRFSLHDGPGIRTTVFLKGCNMRCAWCHNPETISMKSQLHTYIDRCMGCGHCVEVCKSGARKIIDGSIVYSATDCISCGACAQVCFTGALALSGKSMTPEQVMDEILQDKDYYDHSGGGVTISGGEALCQQEFLRDILTLCRENGISTAIETNLNYPYSLLEDLLPILNLVMFDIKTISNDEHIKWTGVSNNTVLENARRLLLSGFPAIVRTPIVSGVTDTPDAIAKIADLIKDSPSLLYYELLNFNPLGEAKYTSLGMENTFKGVRPLSAAELEQLAQTARAFGVTVRV